MVRDYDGNPVASPTPTGPIPITLQQQFTMETGGTLQLRFDADAWDSMISFGPGIEDRVLAHILVCFLAYVLWKALGQMAGAAGLGTEPWRVLDELSKITMMDVVLPTRCGVDIRRRCVTQPTEHQAILLQRMGLRTPRQKKD